MTETTTDPALGYPNTYYAATAEIPPPRPALGKAVTADVCVVGGGFAGVSAALNLAERGFDVVLLESRRIGWGASGRNGGQVNSGLRQSPEALVAAYGAERARVLWEMTEQAKALVRGRIERHEIDAEYKRGTLYAAYKPAHVPGMARNVEVMREVFGYHEARTVDRDELHEMLATPLYHSGVLDRGGGHLHPLKFALGLARAAEEAGVRIFENSPVLATSDLETRPRVETTAAGQVTAGHVVFCCNAYLDRLVPELTSKILPIRNHIIATEPLGEDLARTLIRDDVAVCDSKFVVDYYRLSADRRLLFGGGETYSRHGPRDVRRFVRPYMLRVFPQLADARIDYGWEGQVGITMSRLPHFGRLTPRAYVTHGFSGHGVPLTSLAGKLTAEAIAGEAEGFDVFAALKHRDFPGGALLRRPAQVLGMLFYALRDRL